ncbi:MAG: AAA family ATPase [Planctomycetales bacterium]|nr:AAA family ATPase [Planctomycetales bacterium]
MTWHNVESYFDTLACWLDLEGVAERERLALRRQTELRGDPERSGETLVQLDILDHHIGLAGRILLDLAKANGQPLPHSRLRVGSPVILSDQNDPSDTGISGVVSRRTANEIQVAVERWPEAERYRLDLSPDESTRRKQLSAMSQARLATGRTARLRDVLLGLQAARFDTEPVLEFQTNLNVSQQKAVSFSVSARDVAIVHGPPGTGKTTTLAEIIFQAVARGEKVLACAASNTAVDNLMERLLTGLDRVVRVGHPARVFESLRGHTLDELVDSDSTTQIVREIRKEIEQLMRAAKKVPRGGLGNRQRGEMYAEAGRLRQEARTLERSVLRYTLDSADVICTTLTIDDELLADRRFDLTVVDEACQCTEPSIWQAMLRSERMVLAGDHCQLPPTVISDVAAREGLGTSLMERLVGRFEHDIFRRLTIQYRMHEQIMQFPSQRFYDNELTAHESVRNHTLNELLSPTDSEAAPPVLEFWDTAGAGWDEEIEPDGQSRLNRREAQWVQFQVQQFLLAGLSAEQVAIITPYAAQVRWLRDLLNVPALEIDSVDGFQGREKEVVLISFVRSNSEGEIGFLKDTRRTNVAITRARRCLKAVGDSATLCHHPFYRELLDYFESQTAYRSVWELPDLMS